MVKYAIIKSKFGDTIVKTNEDGTTVSCAYGTDAGFDKEFDDWVAAGNTPEIIGG